jgi:serine/threonine-protein kinase
LGPEDRDYLGDARAAEARGELAQAKQLYERIWDFRAAASCAARLGDRPEQLRLLLVAQSTAEAAALAVALGPDRSELARAASVLEQRRLWTLAAGLRERADELARAAELYERAQAFADQGRVLELLGRLRDAGRAYERTLLADPPSQDAPAAALGLGRILVGFGEHAQAIPHLQAAARAPAHAEAALGLLVPALAGLGLTHAAERALARLRTLAPATAELPAFLREATRSAPAPAGPECIAGRYRVQRLLAAGGVGRVYLAEDLLRAEAVAVKLLVPPRDHDAGRALEAYQRFLRETRIQRALAHPNVVAVREVDESLGLLVMEYLPGGTLLDRLAEGCPLPPAEVRRIALAVLSALEAAHAHGVVHRDLKPANILFDATLAVKLGDFGIAHLADAGQTQTGGLIGTLAYMSPEQVTGAPITFAADLYALGITCYHMLTGRLPFRGPDLVAQHLGEPLPESGLGPAWDAVLARLCEKAPAGRYGSVGEARAAVAALPVADAAARPQAATPIAESAPPAERYLESVQIGASPGYALFAALDQKLNRQVIVERRSQPLAPDLLRLRALARAGGPGLQRLLRIDEAARLLVYEEPIGDALAPGELDRPSALRFAAELAAALAPLHAEGRAHGAIDPLHVRRHAGAPFVLIAGLPAGDAGSLAEDERAIGALVAYLLPSTIAR